MLRCVIAAITKIDTSNKSCDLAIITNSLSVYKNTLLMVREESANNLENKQRTKPEKEYRKIHGKINGMPKHTCEKIR